MRLQYDYWFSYPILPETPALIAAGGVPEIDVVLSIWRGGHAQISDACNIPSMYELLVLIE